MNNKQVNHSLSSNHAAHAAGLMEGPYGSSHHRGTGVRLSSFGDVISERDLSGGGGGGEGPMSTGVHLNGDAKEPSSYPMSLLINMGRAIGECASE